MHYQPGDILLDKYRIEALIGMGSFGEVYRVTHIGLNVPRAVKIMHKDAPGVGSTEFGDYRKRFQFEAQLGARLNTPTPHPNLLQVFDYAEKGDILVLEMEYASSSSLAERMEKLRTSGEAMPVNAVIQMGIEVAQGLAAIHAVDIVHRDLKPSNILFDQHGHAKVADLGLAQAHGSDSLRSRVSSPPPHPGTPAYMSPEQRDTRDYLPPASDVYALGLVLFEALTGRVYRSQRPGTRPVSLRVEIPGWLDELLVRMLSIDPQKRPWNGHEAARFLRGGQGQIVLSGPAAAASYPESSAPISAQITSKPGESSATYAQETFPESSSTGPSSPPARIDASVLHMKPEQPTPNAPWRKWILPLGIIGSIVCIGVGVIGARFLMQLLNPTSRPITLPSILAADTSTPNSILEPTTSNPILPPTDTPQPTSTTMPKPRMFNFQSCLDPCTGNNSVSTFPEKTTKIYLQWQYENIPANASYIRIESFGGMEWARYECIWPHASSGTDSVTFTEPDGIRSGNWLLTIIINGDILVTENITVQGNWDYWSPAGKFTTCYGKR
jgi:serine/threonine protein kinase